MVSFQTFVPSFNRRAKDQHPLILPLKHSNPTPKNKERKKSVCLTDIPDLLDQIENGAGWERTSAIRSIYLLSDVHHQQNRVQMVYSEEYDVLAVLASCLSTEESGDGLRLTCLALNNLSVPDENKYVMACGPVSNDIIDGLGKIIHESKQECYLACICLMNLALNVDAMSSMLWRSPSQDTNGSFLDPLDNPHSLLRILERLLQINSSSAKARSTSSGKIIRQSECVRWACGLIKNLAQCEKNAALMCKTAIPSLIVELLQCIPKSNLLVRGDWQPNSLESFAIDALGNLAKWPGSTHNALIQAGAMKFIQCRPYVA